jgi:hypothetical protein
MHSLLKKCKKTHFLMEFHPKTLNFKFFLDLIDVYHYYTP